MVEKITKLSEPKPESAAEFGTEKPVQQVEKVVEEDPLVKKSSVQTACTETEAPKDKVETKQPKISDFFKPKAGKEEVQAKEKVEESKEEQANGDGEESKEDWVEPKFDSTEEEQEKKNPLDQFFKSVEIVTKVDDK